LNATESEPNITIVPTRRLTAKERSVFDRVVSDFVHLQGSDAEQLTQYAEAVVRYQTAAKEIKKNPNISIPVVNRATGNIVGEKLVRNPAFATVKETQTQMNTLARRLMIDAHSAEKRQRLLTRKARALAAVESKHSSDSSLLAGITEEQIKAEIEMAAKIYIHATPDVLRQDAIWTLTVFNPMMSIDPCTDPDLAYMYSCPE